MIGHEDKGMNQVFLLLSIFKQHFYEQPRRILIAKDRIAIRTNRGHEKCSLRVHAPGLKPGIINVRFRTAKAVLFHGGAGIFGVLRLAQPFPKLDLLLSLFRRKRAGSLRMTGCIFTSKNRLTVPKA